MKILPRQIEIEVTNACNLRCIGCAANGAKTSGYMDFDFFKSIIDRAKVEVPNVTLVTFMNGEPMMHPHYGEMMEYVAKSKLRAYFTTNGHFLKKDIFDTVLDNPNFYQIIFSLDGLPIPESRSIEVARPGSDRKQVMETIEWFGQRKLEKKSSCDMGIKIIQRGQDYEEIERYIHFWLSKPYIDYVCVGRLLNVKTDGMRIYPCKYSEGEFLVVSWDGKMLPCAYCWEIVNNRMWDLGTLGKTESLIGAYNNEAYTSFRADQHKGVWRPVCDKCGFAYCGKGFDGELVFRDNDLKNLGPVSYHFDYYNQFYSLKRKRYDYKVETIA